MRALDIMTTDVVTVAPDARVADVARLFLEHRIGAAPVIDDLGLLVGMISEVDLMRQAAPQRARRWWLALLAESAKGPRLVTDARVRDVMTVGVVSIDADAPLAEIAYVLESCAIKRVPVLRAERLVGIVSRADVLRGLAAAGSQPNCRPTDADRKAREKILGLVRQRKSVSPDAISVIAVNGCVYLWGSVETEADQSAIRAAAQGVVGVDKVHDLLNTLPQILKGAARWPSTHTENAASLGRKSAQPGLAFRTDLRL